MELLDLARRLKPIVLGWFDEATMGVTPGSHALDPALGPHTGTLTLTYLDQSGAAMGEAPVWDGAAWTPTNIITAAEFDHGGLAGLGDDDHPQYAGIAQAETITGVWTHAANVVLDDGAGDSPSLNFVGGSNNDTAMLWLRDDATAGDSDLVIRLCAADADSQLVIQNSASAMVAYVDAAGNADLIGQLDVGNAAGVIASNVWFRTRGTTTATTGNVYAGNMIIDVEATGASSVASYGNLARASINTAQSYTGAHIGFRGEAIVSSGIAADVKTLIGVDSRTDVEDSATTNAMALRATTPAVDTGSLTVGYGLFIQQGTVGVGSITTLYGIYVKAITAGGTNYAFYSAGANSNSYHAGNFSVGGTVTPLAQLHVDQSGGAAAIPAVLIDQGDTSEQCIVVSSDSTDRDIHILTVDVTGTPALDWDESEDDLAWNMNLSLSAGDFKLASGYGVIHADSAAGYILRDNGTRIVPVDPVAYTPFAPTARGDLIAANATPAWARLMLSVPAAGVCNYLGVDNGETDPSWKSASSNPGAAVAMLQTNASGYVQLAGVGIGVACGAGNQVTIVDGGTVGGTGPTLTFDATNSHLEVTGAELHMYGYDLVLFADAGISETMRLNHDDDFSTGPDIIFGTGGAIAANDNLYLLIDADDGTTTAAFIIGKDASTDGYTEIMRVMEAGFVGLNETENAGMDVGVTINQAGYDTEIITVKSSDVNHGMTDVAEADTYGYFKKASSVGGGLNITGLTDADTLNNGAVNMWGYLGEAALTTKSAVGYGIINLLSLIKDGVGATTPGADQNLLAICASTDVKFIFDVEGEMHSDAVIGDGNDWDEWDDLALAADMSRLPRARWGDLVRYNVTDFERAGLVTLSVDADGRRHAFYRHRAMLDFHNCCFADVYQRLRRYEQVFELLGVSPALLEQVDGI